MSYGVLARAKAIGSPVHLATFLKSLLQIWRPPSTKSGTPGPLKLAVAVSGGSDSMTLATFCSQIAQSRNQNGLSDQIRLQAFIVDHGARIESTQEAEQVKLWLHKHLGMSDTKILPIKWPHGVTPSELSNFETEARSLRYKALGKACYEANIPSLLVGHHEADERETLIMRLIEGYRGEGLRGISSVADIPHCQAIYGAYGSGGRNYNVAGEDLATAEISQTSHKLMPLLQDYRKPGFEYGGVKLYRPLLGYNKRTLQATLEAAGVPWVNDPTNIDPTLSIRNTIRHLLQRGLLPKALDSGLEPESSTLRIVARNIDRKYRRRNHRAAELFQACSVISFNAKSGCLHVRIPISSREAAPNIQDKLEGRRTAEVEHVGARLVQHLLNIVTPHDHIPLQSLEFATQAMFLGFEDPHVPNRQNVRKDQSSVFTVGGVLCQRARSPIDTLQVSNSPAEPVLDPEYTWRLTRQPYPMSLPEAECVVLRPPLHVTNPGRKFNYLETPWQLWDGRYWIQVLNLGYPGFKIRPLRRERLVRLRETLKEQKQDQILKALKVALRSHAPGNLRYTIPAIVDANDEVVILPSLGLKVIGTDHWAWTMQYRIRYKRVVLPNLVKDEVVVALPEREMIAIGGSHGQEKEG
ncbi:MAG: hypothetical protein Q9201_004626 [Fulgogasparrea decipioides]